MSYSASVPGSAPNVFVSTTSQPDLEVGGVQGGDDVGPGDGEQLVAALVGLAAEVVGRQVLGLQPRAVAPS